MTDWRETRERGQPCELTTAALDFSGELRTFSELASKARDFEHLEDIAHRVRLAASRMERAARRAWT